VGREGGDGNEVKEGEIRDEKLRRRNVLLLKEIWVVRMGITFNRVRQKICLSM
jgi:hypothetical protein